ncbi:MAG: hypothetical protein H0V82_12150 [Candidatus Protochlamydia sp.]|nr:hypothetical protein [Candidatus Protochlamydia sp.]
MNILHGPSTFYHTPIFNINQIRKIHSKLPNSPLIGYPNVEDMNNLESKKRSIDIYKTVQSDFNKDFRLQFQQTAHKLASESKQHKLNKTIKKIESGLKSFQDIIHNTPGKNQKNIEIELEEIKSHIQGLSQKSEEMLKTNNTIS